MRLVSIISEGPSGRRPRDEDVVCSGWRSSLTTFNPRRWPVVDLSDPDSKYFASAVGNTAGAKVTRFISDDCVVADIHSQGIEDDDRVHMPPTCGFAMR